LLSWPLALPSDLPPQLNRYLANRTLTSGDRIADPLVVAMRTAHLSWLNIPISLRKATHTAVLW
jgi:hypothetical protein